MATVAPVGLVHDRPRAGVLLKPLRLEILSQARTPASASTIAAALKRPRQVVNYHVRQLARAGFLRRAGRLRKRGLVEQRYVASARAFLLAPDVLGSLDTAADDSPSRTPAPDTVTAGYLLTLAGRLQREITASWRAAHAAGEALPVLSVDTEFRFASARARAQFAIALTDAVSRVIAEHTVSAATAGDADCTSPRALHRLVLGCYPVVSDPRVPH